MMESVSPFWFRQEDIGWKSAVREQEELVIIVPCQEGGEREFVEQEPFLKEIALRDGEVGRNILSPARAKGLEYDRVLLYRFGEYATQQFPALMQRMETLSAEVPDTEERLPWEYFLNQLYVAASRARKRLFVIDSEEGYRKFWRFTAPETRRELLAMYGAEQIWTPEVLGGMVQGDDQSWSEDRDNPLQLAERFEQQGRMEKDPYLLNMARRNYLRADRPEKAGLCEASGLEFEARYDEAGNRFVAFGRGGESCRCFWSGQEFGAILSLVQGFPEIAHDPRYLAARFLQNINPTWIQATQILERLVDFISREPDISPGELATWSQFVDQFIARLKTLAVQTAKAANEVDQAIERLRQFLGHLGLSAARYRGIAELLYHAGCPREAIEHWRTTIIDKNEEPEWLIRAHAEINPYPAKLRYIVRLKDDRALVDAWRQAGEDRGKEGEWIHHILASARNLQDWATISELLPHLNNIEDSLESLKLALQEEHQDLLAQFPVAFFQLLARQSEWQQFLRFAEKQETGNSECDNLLKRRNLQWHPDALRAMAIRVLARSDELSKEETKAQQTISDFLRRFLVSDRKTKPAERRQVQMLLKYLSLAEGGVALERANRLTFALEYYEQWFTESQFTN